MTRKRSRLEICLDVLEVLEKKSDCMTHVMYKSNLSWLPLNKLLNNLESKGWIKSERSIEYSAKYSITDKGREMLKFFRINEIKEIMSI